MCLVCDMWCYAFRDVIFTLLLFFLSFSFVVVLSLIFHIFSLLSDIVCNFHEILFLSGWFAFKSALTLCRVGIRSETFRVLCYYYILSLLN